MIKDVPEAVELSDKAGYAYVTTVGAGLAGVACIAGAYNMAHLNATSRSLYLGGGLAIIGALGFNFYGNYLVDKTIRVYNEKATLRVRVPRAEAGLGFDRALKF